MARTLKCGIQHNLYVPNRHLKAFDAMTEAAEAKRMSPSEFICKMIEEKYGEKKVK